MPELPEVETTVRGLRARVVGQTITGFWCDWPRMVRYISPTQFARQIKGAKITGVRRRGKNIILDLNNRLSVVAHMKMTGHFLVGKYTKTGPKVRPWEPALKVGPLNDPYNRFVHVVFGLKNGKHIAFSDMRKFGKMVLHETANLHTSKELGELGPELWEVGVGDFVKIFNPASHLAKLELRRTKPIKLALLDQMLLAGVGNIYSDEGLWLLFLRLPSFLLALPRA